jgi:hypothetical protein
MKKQINVYKFIFSQLDSRKTVKTQTSLSVHFKNKKIFSKNKNNFSRDIKVFGETETKIKTENFSDYFSVPTRGAHKASCLDKLCHHF